MNCNLHVLYLVPLTCGSPYNGRWKSIVVALKWNYPTIGIQHKILQHWCGAGLEVLKTSSSDSLRIFYFPYRCQFTV